MSIFNKKFIQASKGKFYSLFASTRINTFENSLDKGAFLDDIVSKAYRLGGDCYVSDGLFVWGRIIGWIRDKKFRDATSVAQPSEKDGGVDSAIAWRTHVACWAASRACEIAGDFFEFGCHEGYTATAIRAFNSNKFEQLGNRSYYWFDMFMIGVGGSQKKTVIDQSGSESKAISRAKMHKNTVIIKGNVIDTYVKNSFFDGKKIAFAHFDLNDFGVEMAVLEKAFLHVEKGSVLLFDDFAMCPFKRQNRGYRDFFRSRGIEILELPTGQGVVII